ncbi:MAG: glutaredoxin family protein [Candidatus Marinimicrobia bacterium]|nr:glutaredoxin family protein [Candidatus Neomarinimicrobiota bacterium]
MSTIRDIHSFSELEKQFRTYEHFFLLLFKKGNEHSDCAFANIQRALDQTENITLFAVDLHKVRDIHSRYGITSVPDLLEFERSELKNIIRGCNDHKFYKNIFQRPERKKGNNGNSEKSLKRVTVYSTPSCPWCNTVKSYLREHHIPFRDTDISRDMRAAEDLVKRSGQRGVPQTEINGKIVVGFDKERLNKLLDIKG